NLSDDCDMWLQNSLGSPSAAHSKRSSCGGCRLDSCWACNRSRCDRCRGLTFSLLIDSSAMDTHCFTQEQLWQKCRIGHKFSRKVLAFHRDVSHTVPSTSLK